MKGQDLKDIRLKLNLKTTEVAELTKMPRQLINAIENGYCDKAYLLYLYELVLKNVEAKKEED